MQYHTSGWANKTHKEVPAKSYELPNQRTNENKRNANDGQKM